MSRNKPTLLSSCSALFLLAGLMACASHASAQESTTTQAPPMYRGVQTHVDGVFVTPVPNEPLTAVVELKSTQVLDDGSSVSKKTFNGIARDSQGRIYNERRDMLPETSNATPAVILIHIFDPNTKLNTFLNPSTHVALQSLYDRPQQMPVTLPVTRPGNQAQDVGTESMENVVVHGTKTTHTISAASSGTGKPVTVTDEVWYSDELHLNMLVKHNDPRTGEQTVTITKVERSEPPVEKFEIPADYKILDETPVSK